MDYTDELRVELNRLRRTRDIEDALDALGNFLDAWEEERKSYEVLRSGIRSLWHSVVDGDMDKLSVGYALKELFR